MADGFAYDVFLSYSVKDEEIVCAIAERLKAAGLRVWFDEWEIKPRTKKALRAKKIEEGLDRSRVLVLCTSAHAFGSDWAQLEAGTFRFRDPLNAERRFIPLRLDDAPIPRSLSQLAWADWTAESREAEYPKLLEVCRPPLSKPAAPETSDAARLETRAISLGHTDSVRTVALSLDGKRALTGSEDNTVRIWDVESGTCIRVLEGHSNAVRSVHWSGDSVFSGAANGVMRIWDARDLVSATRAAGASVSPGATVPQ